MSKFWQIKLFNMVTHEYEMTVWIEAENDAKACEFAEDLFDMIPLSTGLYECKYENILKMLKDFWQSNKEDLSMCGMIWVGLGSFLACSTIVLNLFA